jgi:hypothetical protein
MTNPLGNAFLVRAKSETKTLDKDVWLSPEYDDDDDADGDDADDEILQGPWRGQGWQSRSDFGSPEWWTQA